MCKDLYGSFKLNDENHFDFSKFYESRERTDLQKLLKYVVAKLDILNL